jgi:hypothetical protein
MVRPAFLLFVILLCSACPGSGDNCDDQRNILGTFVDSGNCGQGVEDSLSPLEGGFEDGFQQGETGSSDDEGGDACGSSEFEGGSSGIEAGEAAAEAMTPEGGDVIDSSMPTAATGSRDVMAPDVTMGDH